MLLGHTFSEPLFLITLVIPILLAVYSWRRSGLRYAVLFPSLQLLAVPRPTLRERLRHVPHLLRLSTLSLIGVALAGPIVLRTNEQNVSAGLDIMLLIDASRSMLAQDLKPSRFEAAKQLTERLARSRTNDRFGLMTFAARSRLQCPITSDDEAFVGRVRRTGTLESEEGTALGVALADVLKQIRSGGRGPRVIVLLTDGASNAGEIAPETAATIAAGMGVRIYTVGLAGRGPARYPTEFGPMEVSLDLDEGALQTLSSRTGGVYIPADPTATTLDRLSTELNRIETPVSVTRVERTRADAFDVYLFAALTCLLLELLLRAGYLRAFP